MKNYKMLFRPVLLLLVLLQIALVLIITWEAPHAETGRFVLSATALGITVLILLSSKNNAFTNNDEHFKALINSMADGVIATDSKRKITIYNGAALNMLNLNVSLEDSFIDDQIKLVNQNNELTSVESLTEGMRGYFISRDYSLMLKDNTKLNIYLGVAPVKESFGHKSNYGYVFLLRDITKEKSLEEERDEFVSVVSHELRTPTAIVEGNISNATFLLQKNAPHEKLLTALDDAHKQAIFLSGLINDLSTLSRAERGVLKVEPEDIDVNEFIQKLAKYYEPEARQKSLSFTVHTDSSVGQLKTSKLYLQEILQNILINAIKYTKTGGVEISLETEADGVSFVIKDTGIGISEVDQKRLFEKFFRSEDYRTRENSGTGLGLYVTKKLADLLKAKITVKSVLNSGSEFKVSVPNYRKGNV